MNRNDVQDILDLSNLLTTGKPAAEVIADLIDWRDGVSTTKVVVPEQEDRKTPAQAVAAPVETPAPAKSPTKAPAKKAPAKAKPEPSPDPSSDDDADF